MYHTDLNLTGQEHLTRACWEATINCTGAKHCEVHCAEDHGCGLSNILCSNDCVVNGTVSHHGVLDALWYASIHIPEYSNSSILCTGYDSCDGLRIDVEANAILNTICEGGPFGRICDAIIIHAHSDNISINVLCNGSIAGDPRWWNTPFSVCDYLNINGSRGTNSSITTSCFAHDEISACFGSTISGGQDASITTICSHNIHSMYGWGKPCEFLRIAGGSGSDINVSCTDYAECEFMKIDGQNAASLVLGDCSGNVKCIAVTIWCPQQVDGEKRCELGKGDNLQILDLYAVNSWDDVELTTPIDCPCGNAWNGPTLMHCGENYGDVCNVGVSNWAPWFPVCDDPSSGCDVEQEPNEFTTCGVPEERCKPTKVPTPAPYSESHLSTDRIVIIVLAVVCGVLVIAAVILVVMMVRKKETGPDPEAIPLSEESDAFMQSDNH